MWPADSHTSFALNTPGPASPIALKVLASQGANTDIQLKRSFREARVTSGLRHPNTIRVFDFGMEDDGTVYLAMEVPSGQTLNGNLQSRMRHRKVFTEEEVIRIACTIMRSLGKAD